MLIAGRQMMLQMFFLHVDHLILAFQQDEHVVYLYSVWSCADLDLWMLGLGEMWHLYLGLGYRG